MCVAKDLLSCMLTQSVCLMWLSLLSTSLGRFIYYRRVHFIFVREPIILNIHHLVTGFRPVSQLYFSDITADSLAVAWSAPAPPANNFKLRCSTDDSSEEYEVVLDGSKTRIVISGLLPSKKYTVTLVTMHGDTASEPVTGTVVTGTAASVFKQHPL